MRFCGGTVAGVRVGGERAGEEGGRPAGTSDFNINDSSSQGQIPWTQRVSQGAYVLQWESPFFQRYLTCFYWAVTTLVKVPFTIPRTNGEQIFTFFFIWVGAISFAVIIGEVTAWVGGMRAAQMARGDALGRVRKFCVMKKVPAELQKKAYAWIVANQDYAASYAGKPVLANLSGKIRTEVGRHPDGTPTRARASPTRPLRPPSTDDH